MSPPSRKPEKAKDFSGTWKKLLGYCKEYRIHLIVSLLCAFAGTILTLMGPGRIADLTDTISAGILTGIDMEKVQKSQ